MSTTVGREQRPAAFLQSRPTTCGVACCMMVMHDLLGTDLSRTLEGSIRHRLKTRYYDIVPVISIARYLFKAGLSVRVIHERPDLFWERMRAHPVMLQEQEIAYKRAARDGLRVHHSAVTIEALKSELSVDALVILGISLGPDVKHAILLFNCVNDTFGCVDPLRGYRYLHASENARAMQLDTGAWYLAVKAKSLTSCRNAPKIAD